MGKEIKLFIRNDPTPTFIYLESSPLKKNVKKTKAKIAAETITKSITDQFHTLSLFPESKIKQEIALSLVL